MFHILSSFYYWRLALAWVSHEKTAGPLYLKHTDASYLLRASPRGPPPICRIIFNLKPTGYIQGALAASSAGIGLPQAKPRALAFAVRPISGPNNDRNKEGFTWIIPVWSSMTFCNVTRGVLKSMSAMEPAARQTAVRSFRKPSSLRWKRQGWTLRFFRASKQRDARGFAPALLWFYSIRKGCSTSGSNPAISQRLSTRTSYPANRWHDCFAKTQNRPADSKRSGYPF